MDPQKQKYKKIQKKKNSSHVRLVYGLRNMKNHECYMYWFFSLGFCSFLAFLLTLPKYRKEDKEKRKSSIIITYSFSFVRLDVPPFLSHFFAMKDGWFVDRKLFHSILVSEGHFERAPTSPPSTGCLLLLLSCGWISTELIELSVK